MNIRRIALFAALFTAVLSLSCFIHPVSAQVTYQWDPAQNGTGSDGPGNWDSSSTNWAVGGADVIWSDGNDAVIGAHTGAASTITLAGQVTPNSINFNPAVSGNYVLASGSINLPNSSTLVTVNASAMISSPLVGSGGLSVAGAGTLTLSGGNTYRGATTIASGSRLLIGNAPLALPTLASGTLQRWYDAADVNNGGAQPANGDAISTWSDKSGMTQDAMTSGGITPTYVANGINGRPSIQLGANSYLSFATTGLAEGADGSTIFAVGQLTSPLPGWDWMVAYGNAGTAQARGIGMTSGSQIDYTAFGADVQAPPIVSTGRPIFADAVFGGAGSSVVGYYNYSGISGSVSMNPALNTILAQGNIGKQVIYSEYWAGQVGEILIYNGALSDADRQAVDAYLNYKWTLGANNAAVLPSTTDLSVSSGGTLDLGGNTQQVRSLTGSGIVTNTGSTDATLFVNSPLTPSLFGGVIANGSTNKISLTKAGTGVLILAGVNTYSGATDVSGGTLQIGNGGAGASIGNTSGVTFSNNATLGFNHSDTVVFAPAISGAGNVYKTGSGTLTLATAESYVGATTINQGVLVLGTAPASNILPTPTAVVISSPATLNLNGGSHQVASLSDGIAGGGSVINSSTGSASVLTVSPIGGSTSVFSGSVRGGGTLGAISLVMSGNGTQVLSGNNSYTGGTQLNGGELALAGSGALPPTGEISFAGGALKAANTTDFSPRFSTAPGQAYSMDTNGQSLTWAAPLTSSGGSLTKLGAGTLTLTGSNTYSGTTNVNGGVLMPTSTASLPGYNTSGAVNVANGATLSVPFGGVGDWTSGQIGALATAGNFNFGGTLGLDTSHGNATFGGVLAQPLTLNKLGPNTLTLTGANTNTGGATVTAGTLQLGNGLAGNNGSLSGNITNNSTLVYNPFGTQTYGGSIVGSGGLTKAGPGTLILSGLTNYAGPTAISGGILSIRPSNALPDVTGGGITLQRWYDANDVNNGSAQPSNGDTLATWSDKSGNAVDAIAQSTPTFASSGINGKPAIQLGNPNYFTFSQTGLASGSQPSTMFAVGVLGNLPYNWDWMVATGWNSAGGASRGLGVNPSNLLEYNVMYSGVEGKPLGINTPVVMGSVFGGTPNSVAGYWNINGQTGTTAAFNPALVTDVSSGDGRIGHQAGTYDEYWAGGVGEILIYNGALSTTQQQEIESYLERKWILGTTGILPTTTPVAISQGGTLDLTDVLQAIGSLSSTDGQGSKVLLGAVGALTVGDATSTTFDGTISGLGGSVVKRGTGTWVLSGSNTYTGGTTVNSGILLPTTTAALPGYAATNGVKIGAGATIAVPVGAAGDWTGSQIAGLVTHAAWADKTSILGIDTNHGNATYSGALTQPLTLNKLGPNMLTLTGANTNAGGATVTAGTLQLGNGAAGNDGSLSGNITNNSSLVYNLHGTQTYGGSIVGSGGLTKTGPGTLILSGLTNYAGPTNISGGILRVQPSNALPNVTGGGITLQRWYDATDVNNGGAPPTDGDTLVSWSDKSSSAVDAVAQNSPTFVANGINGKPMVQLGNPNYFTFSQTGLASGTQPSTIFAVGMLNNLPDNWDWMVATGWNSGYGASRGLGVNPANLLEYNIMYDGREGPALAANRPVVMDAVFGGTPNSVAGSWNYNGLTGSTAFNPAINTNTSAGDGRIGHQAGNYEEYWAGGVGEILIYNGALSAAQAQLVESYLQRKWITGAAGTLPTTTPVAISQGATLDLTNVMQTIGSLSSTDGLGSKVLLGGIGVLTVGDATSTTFDGTISGPGGSVVKQGAGALTLIGSNTYTGGTTVSQGVLTYLNRSAQPNSGTTKVAAGATLGFGVGSSSSLFGSTDLNNAFAGTMPNVNSDPHSSVGVDTTAGNFTYSSNIPSTTLGLNKLGANLLTLTGSNSYTGPTTITGGSLQIGDGTTSHDGIGLAGNITNNAALVYNLHGAQTYAGVISGSGGLTKAGPGSLVLSGQATYSGATLISGGTLKVQNGNLANISGSGIALQRWYDAADVGNGGAQPANGSAVSTWSDKSGMLQDAVTVGTTAPTFVAKGINGLPAVQFGANSYLSFPTAGLASGADGSTIFVVSQLTSPLPGWDWMVAYGNAAGAQARGIGMTGGSQIDYTAMFVDVQAPPTISTGVPIIADAVFGGAGSSVVGFYNYNGSSGSVSMNPVLNTVLTEGNIGKQVTFNEYWAGQIGEVLIYNGALTDAERQAVETYLQRKWVLKSTGNLPPTTPVSMSQGATLDLTDVVQTIASLSSTDGMGSLVLLGSGALTVGDATTTTFDGTISGVGGSLIKQGAGTLVLSGSDNYTGGTTVIDGTLALATPTALPDGSSLTVGTGGSLAFGSALAVSLGAGAAAVPEPGTLALLVAGAIVGAGLFRRRRVQQV
jgi:fibronectin-binding autotransporter adhesin